MKIFALIVFFIPAFPFFLSAQDTISISHKGYKLSAVYSDTGFCSVLYTFKDGKEIQRSECADRIVSMGKYDLDGSGSKLIVLEYFTGGAHCCVYMTAGTISGGKYSVLDTIFWGDSGFEIKDLDGDGKLEVKGSMTYFAYAFTNFAQSRFPLGIYKFRNGKFYVATGEFPELVLKDISVHKKELDEYVKSGFNCPATKDEDTFNTDAGAVKAILAPIVADYYALNEVDKGYALVRKVYKCVDAEQFIGILKSEYYLK